MIYKCKWCLKKEDIEWWDRPDDGNHQCGSCQDHINNLNGSGRAILNILLKRIQKLEPTNND